MTEDVVAPAPDSTRCPWCSAVAPAGAVNCPSCGAALIASAEGTVPGVTSIDAEAVLRGRNPAKPRGGLLGLLSGETGDTVEAPSAAELSSLAPPGVDVRMEMIRLELEAERQRLAGEAAGMAADAVVEGEISSIPPGVIETDGEEAPPPGPPQAGGPPATTGAPGGATPPA
jgi:hypothetical protein